jgi:L-fuculose-phosphate aldolase
MPMSARPQAGDLERLASELIAVARKAVARDLVAGPGGNLSAVGGGVMLISPSGAALDELTADSLVRIGLDSGRVEGPGRPSSEWAMHLACYRVRPDIAAVVHTHPPVTIGVISAGARIEAMFPDSAVLLPEVRVLDYMLPTTEALAQAVAAAARSADVVLLRNHGVVTLGRTLREAFYRSELVEASARILVAARTVGTPRVLTQSEIAEIRALESEQYRIRHIAGGDGP